MREVVKRGLDVALSSVSLLVLSPVFAVTGAVVLGTMGRPILFVQDRPGRNGRIFRLYKFRTMRDACDENGEVLPDATRLTALGRFLRATSLDELPELINVLKGEMSLVGPRPLRVEYLGLYSPEQARRHDVRPGITGWAQVNGRNTLSWEKKFECDVWYVDHQSLALDLKILGLTVLNVVRGVGVSAPQHATMPRFTGSSRTDPDPVERGAVHDGR